MTPPGSAAQTREQWFTSRKDERAAFLDRTGWRDANPLPIGEDGALRHYFRLIKNDRTAVLMESIPDDVPDATPGHMIGDFLRIAALLRSVGLNAPEIYETDEAAGYVLLEDFGDRSFKGVLKDGMPAEDIYTLAVDTLAAMQHAIPQRGIELPLYYDSHVHTGLIRLVDWYRPVVRGVQNEDAAAAGYLAAWRAVEKDLPPCPQGFLHVDYHVKNLMYLPERTGLMRCGILDFQGAMWGPLPYDLANLLEDARYDIPVALRRNMLAHYCRDMNAEEAEAFRLWYRVLATQFHCRVIGQFIRLAVWGGKTRYLDYLPRLAGYIDAALADPVLMPLRRWVDEQGLGFKSVPAVDPERVRSLIRDDAY